MGRCFLTFLFFSLMFLLFASRRYRQGEARRVCLRDDSSSFVDDTVAKGLYIEMSVMAEKREGLFFFALAAAEIPGIQLR